MACAPPTTDKRLYCGVGNGRFGPATVVRDDPNIEPEWLEKPQDRPFERADQMEWAGWREKTS